MEEFMTYMANCTIFFCGLFLLFASVEYVGNKIEKAVKDRRKVKRIVTVKRIQPKQSHFYNLIIE